MPLITGGYDKKQVAVVLPRRLPAGTPAGRDGVHGNGLAMESTDSERGPLAQRCPSRRVGRVGRLNEIFNQPSEASAAMTQRRLMRSGRLFATRSLGRCEPPLTWRHALLGKQFTHYPPPTPTWAMILEQVDVFLYKAQPRLAAMRATDKGPTIIDGAPHPVERAFMQLLARQFVFLSACGLLREGWLGTYSACIGNWAFDVVANATEFCIR